MAVKTVGLAWIDFNEDPIDLFKTWRETAVKFKVKLANACCLATVRSEADGNNRPSSRNMMLQAFDENGFTFITDKRSEKVKDLQNNSYASMCFLWIYKNEEQHLILRQVRIEGSVKEIEKTVCEKIYNDQPLFCKVRSYLCHQDQSVEWDDLNEKCKELTSQAQCGLQLPMPDHEIGYRLIPERMEFYYAWNFTGTQDMIADRIRYTKEGEEWKSKRIAA